MKYKSLFAERPLAHREAFTDFYEKTHQSVFRYAMAHCGGEQRIAEDVTSETYLRAWKYRRRFKGDADQAMGWVLTIARNNLIDRHRHNAHHKPAVDVDDIQFEPADDGPDPESWYVSEESLGDIIKAMQHLSETQREIIVLRYVMGWRVREIAERLDLRPNTVSVQQKRALVSIKKHLQEQDEEYSYVTRQQANTSPATGQLCS